MKEYKFVARGVCSEFNITEIGKYFGLLKKIKWEEPLIIDMDKNDDKIIYLYHFGVIVFINFDDDDEITTTIDNIKNIEGSIKSINQDIEYDEVEIYTLIEDEKVIEKEVEFNYYKVNLIEKYVIEMTSLVLAKSVALEIIENNVNKAFDEIEEKVLDLKRGKLKGNDKKVVSTIGKIISFKHTTISYIMMLDKPTVAWKIQEAEKYFNETADLFELDDRYNNLNAKLETLLNTVEIIADLQHSKTANIMELIVLLLILIEVIHAFEGPIFNIIRNVL